jgi:hypothetical protein
MSNVKDYGTLVNYQTNETIRAATREEMIRSIEQAKRDGGAGVISVDGVSCFVLGGSPRRQSIGAKLPDATPTNYERAEAMAHRYRNLAEREGSRHAACRQIAEDIAGLVGPRIPASIRAIMGTHR